MARPRLVAVTLVAVTLVATGLAPAAPAAPLRGVPDVTLRVLTLNIEYGGTVVDLNKIVAAVRRADADIVGLNEAYAHTRRIAREAGYDFVDRSMDVISRYPLLKPPAAQGDYLYVQLAPGQVVAIANIHLSSAAYGPRKALDGWSRRRLLDNERAVRLPELRPFTQALEPVAAAGVPSFIIGDFNAPSHMDWTAATVGQRPQIRWPVAWPTSRLMERRGFVDTFRAVFPDPVTHPGLTWPANRPWSPDSWNPPPDAPKDRIDQVWVGGPATTLDSQLVGESRRPGVDIGVRPWGSDHRGVVSTVQVTPGTPPVFVAATPDLVNLGAEVETVYHAPGGAGERVVIVPAGGDPATDEVDAAPTPGGAPVDGSLAFDTTSWATGGYDAVLVDASDAELSRSSFWVREPGAPPTVSTSRWRYAVGEPIVVAWQGAPGRRFDWIGVYRRGANPQVAYYLGYVYTGATVTGSGVFDEDAPGGWPLPAGRYTVYYLVNDSYRQIAGDDFVVAD